MRTLVIASTNEGKVAEFRHILDNLLGSLSLTILSASEAGVLQFPPEGGATYEENAFMKAAYVAAKTGQVSLGDDSGLEVDALDGAPGLYSARYGGTLGNGERIAHLLQNLRHVSQDQRGARFVCSLVLATPKGNVKSFWGECKGEILEGPRGSGGFGYDSVFYSHDLKQSFAQTTAGAKAHVSHRGRALQAMAEWLLDASKKRRPSHERRPRPNLQG